jgi:predicted hydrolase (HD superfamily)
MLPVMEIENFVKEETKNVELITHSFDHLKRTAIGSRWFVKILNGSKEEQDLAYIAGLLHDIFRPGTGKKPHAETSADRSGEILKKFNLDENFIQMIIQAIRDHSMFTQWDSVLHQSVFLADKILELMGGYAVFRRSVYVGECKDFIGVPFKEAMLTHWSEKIGKWAPERFPNIFRKLTKQRHEFLIIFFEAFKKENEWAIKLAEQSYMEGKIYRLPLEGFIKNFIPVSEVDEKIQKDAIDYINGKKFKEFEKLVKK